jgi:hypothetical protein
LAGGLGETLIGAPEQQKMWMSLLVMITARTKIGGRTWSWVADLALGVEIIWFWGEPNTTVKSEQAGWGVDGAKGGVG